MVPRLKSDEAPIAVGAASLQRIEESCAGVLDPFEIYPDAQPAHLAENLGWLAPRFYDPDARRLILAFQGFVVRSEGRVILVDTCVGDCKTRTRPVFHQGRWGWIDRLAAAGLPPESIDLVVCTHFHVDHVGWNTRLRDGRWVPTFPNARYLFPRRECEYWSGPAGAPGLARAGDYYADSVAPVIEAGLADLVEPGHVLTGEVQLREAHGHTPGSVAVAIRSLGASALLAGDVLHTLLQVRYPQWSTRFCVDPDRSRRTRVAMLEEAADSGTLLVPNHFPGPSFGRIERRGGAFRFHYLGETEPVFA